MLWLWISPHICCCWFDDNLMAKLWMSYYINLLKLQLPGNLKSSLLFDTQLRLASHQIVSQICCDKLYLNFKQWIPVNRGSFWLKIGDRVSSVSMTHSFIIQHNLTIYNNECLLLVVLIRWWQSQLCQYNIDISNIS